MANVKIGHASIDERGKITGGSAGDQTGKEVCVRDWYLHKKGWVVLRCKNPQKRLLIAEAMEKACGNSHIGYDQNQRDSLFSAVKGLGFDPSKVTTKVETDCSALVRVCIAYAYGRDLVGNIRTISEPDMLVATGEFEKLTDDKYCTSSKYLLRGDVLVTPTSGHTVVCLDNGVASTKEDDSIVKVKNLKKGCKGDHVKALQALLIGYGYDLGSYGADGDFGGATESAVRKYQSRNGLTTDGVVGDKTWAKLLGVA